MFNPTYDFFDRLYEESLARHDATKDEHARGREVRLMRRLIPLMGRARAGLRTYDTVGEAKADLLEMIS